MKNGFRGREDLSSRALSVRRNQLQTVNLLGGQDGVMLKQNEGKKVIGKGLGGYEGPKTIGEGGFKRGGGRGKSIFWWKER